MASTRELVVRMRTDVATLKRDLKRSQQDFKKFGRDSKKSLDPINKAFKGIALAARGLIPALGAAAFGNAIRTQIAFADELGKVAKQLGGTTEFIHQATFAAARFNIEQTTITKGLKDMTAGLAEAAGGTGEAKKAFEALGLDAKELIKLDLEGQFTAILGALSKVSNKAQEVDFSEKIFGGRGATIARLKDDFAGLAAELDKLGGPVTQDVADAAAEAADAFTNLGTAFDAFVRDALPPVARGLTFVINELLGLKRAANLITYDNLEEEGLELTKILDRDLALLRAVKKEFAKGGKIQIFGDDLASNEDDFFSFNENDAIEKINRIKKRVDETRARIAQLVSERETRDALGSRGPRDLSQRTPEQKEADALADAERRRIAQQGELAASQKKLKAEYDAANKALTSFQDSALNDGEKILITLKRDLAAIQAIKDKYPELAAAADKATKAVILSSENQLQQQEEELLAHFRGVGDSAGEAAGKVNEFFLQAARNSQDALADFLFDPFEEGIKGMIKSMVDALRRILANFAASAVFKFLGQSDGFLGTFFKGAQRNAFGGNISRGSAHIVGEKGPELFVPGAMGRVVPNNDLKGGGGFNYTSNIDARGASVELIKALPGLLAREREAVKAEVFDMLNRNRSVYG